MRFSRITFLEEDSTVAKEYTMYFRDRVLFVVNIARHPVYKTRITILF